MRPKKDIRFKWNGDYLQVVEDGNVITSLAPDFLCQLAKVKKRFGTKKVLAHISFLKKQSDNGGIGTNQ